MNVMSTASAGVVSALSRFDAASTAVSQAFTPGSNVDPGVAIADQAAAGQQVQASAAGFRASDWMLKQLLDITV